MNSHPHLTHGQTKPSPALPSRAEVTDAPALGVVRLSSQAIFTGAREVEIEHYGALYRLRQTSQGKLILTK
ncbi:MAG: hemin uptake protein HemP [Pseudomonadota bacterium]